MGIDYRRLTKTIDSFIENNRFYINNLGYVENYSRDVLNMDIDTNEDESGFFELNDSISIVYSFLESIDKGLANRFMNVLNSKDENGKTYVNFLLRAENPDGKTQVRDGRVYIYYDNTYNDCFRILHELLHKMNECRIIDQNNQEAETFTRDYFGELVSITGEAMLGRYMVDNDIISENNFKSRMKKRITLTKENARDVIVEGYLVRLRLAGKDLNYDNLIHLIDKPDTSIDGMVLNDEKNDLRRINSILSNGSMNLPMSQRYVLALALSKRLLERDTLVDDFLKINDAVNDPYSDIIDIFNEIINNENNEFNR